jgi:hypothetical protein
MFQYAAARLAAERLGCSFIISQGGFSWRDFCNRRESLQLFRIYPELDRGIGMNCVSLLERYFEGPSEWIKEKLFPTEFRPWSSSSAPWEGLEGFDPAYRTVPKFTRMVGYFQSPLYMKGHEEVVRKWFSCSGQEAVDVGARWSALGLDPDRTVAVHVRLGDYRGQVPLGDNPEGGWILPRTYYQEALDLIGPDLNIALFSDEPDNAYEYIGRQVHYIARTGNIKIDFFMMSSCKYMIIANSTFSWWAAWLNSPHKKIVVSPKFFLGRNISEWYPRDIRVEDWQYL